MTCSLLSELVMEMKTAVGSSWKSLESPWVLILEMKTMTFWWVLIWATFHTVAVFSCRILALETKMVPC